MSITVEGVYRNGRVELLATPENIREARVEVIFYPDPDLQEIPSEEASDSTGKETREDVLKRVLQRMEEGIPLGGPPYPGREELYDRYG